MTRDGRTGIASELISDFSSFFSFPGVELFFLNEIHLGNSVLTVVTLEVGR